MFANVFCVFSFFFLRVGGTSLGHAGITAATLCAVAYQPGNAVILQSDPLPDICDAIKSSDVVAYASKPENVAQVETKLIDSRAQALRLLEKTL